MLKKISRRLYSWGNKYISLEGLIVLLNSVLNSVHVFYLSLFKMPKRAVKKVVGIRKIFLFIGVRGGRKTCWVKWRMVCQPRCMGGLGVRDIKLVNLCLQAKWRWRLFHDDSSFWKRVLVDKYGLRVSGSVESGGGGRLSFASRWCKD
jgi:hypothetical protein